jgi:hypothetical protein
MGTIQGPVETKMRFDTYKIISFGQIVHLPFFVMPKLFRGQLLTEYPERVKQ